MKKTVGFLVAGAAIAMLSTAAFGEMSGGEVEFRASCASCHGASGAGNGRLAELLTVALPDLTKLAENNGGVFPKDRVLAIIDGRENVAAHGDRDMPVWGYEYSKGAVEYYQDFYTKEDAERFVETRLTNLIAYLEAIQK